ncbi:MAG: hypothetical protein GX027_04900 [Clostridiaceae bacterium]|jgi:predicted transcriptional regulator|nr:hypothetical protein [Clostridiaceae bacterium]
MKISEIAALLNAEVYTENHDDVTDIRSACSADLMSDVMAFAKENALLLTGLVNPQVIRTAEMMEMKAIIFVRGKKPQQAMIELAEEKKIALLSTEFPLFEASGRLYQNGIRGHGF